MRETAPCPLCFQHAIDKKDKIDGFHVGAVDVLIPQVIIDSCATTLEELQTNRLLAEKELMPFFKVSIYLTTQDLRFVFERQKRRGASYLHPPDEAIVVLDSLKIFFTAIFLNELPSHTHGKSAKQIEQCKQLILKIINERFKPFYTAIRDLRKI